jgi:Fe-S cluster biosynthesis and repair protein YggX
MARMVHCKKLGKELPGLGFKPFPNELGTRIMNEYRLTPADPRTQQILYQQAEQFFFGPGAEAPPEYKPR